MGEFSFWHWAIFIVYFAAIGIPLWRIAKKAGFSGWWSIAAHIPFVNLLALWAFAFVKWPASKE